MEKEKASQWILWFVLIPLFLLGNAHPDFISIDCGASSEYTDPQTGISYQTDIGFVETGRNTMVAYEERYDVDFALFGRQLQTLRSFPEGKRNCYNLKPKQGKNNNYLIRAFFAYKNYDAKNQTPSFDLYLNVDFWTTVALNNVAYQSSEIIHTPTTDTIHVCLVNTGRGTPFISTLELRPLNNSIYNPTPSPSESLLVLHTRIDVGSFNLTSSLFKRFKDDIYDRVWRVDTIFDNKGWQKFNRWSKDIAGSINDSYKLPTEVLMSATKSLNRSFDLYQNYDFVWTTPPEKSVNYYVIFHFVEIEKLPGGQKRVIDIAINDEYITEPITLEYLKPVTVTNVTNQDGLRFNISATSESDAPPILNAIEAYKIISSLASPTDQTDADALLNITNTYDIHKADWQGDPCVPEGFAWEGLGCRYDINNINARIISLNLNSSKLTGVIAPSFASLEMLESLDLSNNELTGPLPEFLATLTNLKFINVTGNKLTGSIPKALREKANLKISMGNNPGLNCLTNSCKEHNKFEIPLIASVSSLSIVTVLVSLVIWRFKMKTVLCAESRKKKGLKPKNEAFSYSEVLRITNNFETTIGEGGFGKVYLGTLEDNTQVAVKLLSPSSKQGYKEFQSEAQLLTVVHHRNLVALVGFCDENDVKALIYEYMDLGDLGGLLSEKNQKVLKWSERLQVAVDAAKGLEYLHNGCKTPIIHRDLKPSNILLNKSMVAKIADFGLSRAFTSERDSHLSTQPAGTPGYIDPEFQRSGKLDKRSDIYSFGIILLHLLTGHPPIRRQLDNAYFIIDWIRPKIESGDIRGIVDQRLDGEFRVSSAWRAVETAMSCIEPQPIQRPDISYVYNELQECLGMEIDHANTNGSQSLPINHHSGQLDSITTLSAR